MTQKEMRIIVGGIIGATIINLINLGTMKLQCFWLTENQILYVFSTVAQVIGALLGLTITGYSIADSKLKNTQENDDTSREYIGELRKKSFRLMSMIALISAFVIVLCLWVLGSYNERWWLVDGLMTEVGILFLLVMMLTIWLVYSLRPNAIREEGNLEKREIEEGYSDTSKEEASSFGMFVTYYNLFEQLIKKYAKSLESVSDGQVAFFPEREISNAQMTIFSAINILLQHEVIDRQTALIIDEFRRYRNALVHSTDQNKNVDGNIYDALLYTYSKLKDMYESQEDTVWHTYKDELNKYVDKQTLGSVENEILNLLSNNEYTAQEIINDTRFVPVRVRNALKRLEAAGKIENIKQGKRIIWRRIND